MVAAIWPVCIQRIALSSRLACVARARTRSAHQVNQDRSVLPIRKCDRDRRSFFLNVEVEAFKKYVLPCLSHFLIGGGRSIGKCDRRCRSFLLIAEVEQIRKYNRPWSASRRAIRLPVRQSIKRALTLAQFKLRI